MAQASLEPLSGLLRDTSRSFYLTLRVLPKPIRSPIGLAYLLARTTGLPGSVFDHDASELANIEAAEPQRFGARFIELARAVYVTNDERAAIKKRINTALGSTIVEEKSYAAYR